MASCTCSKEKEIQEIHQAVLGTGNQDGILHQTRKTNGRVNKLEKWRNMLVGGAIVLTSATGLVLGLGSYWLSGVIETSVTAGITDYVDGINFKHKVISIIKDYDE